MKIFLSFFLLMNFWSLQSSGGYDATSKAFMFLLNHNEGLAPFVIKVGKGNTDWAICRSSYYGPRFGYDVIIKNNADSNGNSVARLSICYFVPP